MRVSTERITFALVVSSCLMHVFCCGLPLLASVINMAALFGITGAGMAHSPWFEQFEVMALKISGAMLLLTGGIQYVSRRINCRKEGSCSHEPCDKKKDYSLMIYLATVGLFAFNMLIFVIGH